MRNLINFHFDGLPAPPQGLYLVGGTVRDLLAGRVPIDIDLVVDGDVETTAAVIAERTGGKSIHLGKGEWSVKRIVSPTGIIDLTRLDHPSIEDDLRQRDFTINAMAYDLAARRLVDITGGRQDMARRCIRMVSPQAFERDPARLVRAYRLAASFGYAIDAPTVDAIGRHRHLVRQVPGERVLAELVKIFEYADSASVINLMAGSGLLTAIFPELEAAIGCTQNRHHRLDVFDHSLRAYGELEYLLAGSSRRFPRLTEIDGTAELLAHTAMLKYSALLHDVGKPATRRVDHQGRIHFKGHAARSADMTLLISRRLRLSKRQRETSDAIIRSHLRPLFLYLAERNGTLGLRGMVRFFNHGGAYVLPIIVHAMADIRAKGMIASEGDKGFIAFCHRLLDTYIDTRRRMADGPLLISGHDLIEHFGLSPSPQFKDILRRVDESRLTGDLTSRDQALKWVKAYLSSTSKDPTGAI